MQLFSDDSSSEDTEEDQTIGNEETLQEAAIEQSKELALIDTGSQVLAMAEKVLQTAEENLTGATADGKNRPQRPQQPRAQEFADQPDADIGQKETPSAHNLRNTPLAAQGEAHE